MRRLLTRLASDAGSSDASVTYHIGSSFSGETLVELHRDGSWRLSSNVTAGRRRLELSGTLPPQRFLDLAGELLRARVWEARPEQGIRKQDDPLATISMASDGESHTVGVPASQTHAVESFRSAQEAILSLARELSDGAVLENGR